MIMLHRFATLLLLGVWLLLGAAPNLPPSREAIFSAFADGNHARAAALIDDWVELRPNDASMLYNLACARAQLRELDAATSALYRAVQAGYDDFDHMRTDPDLAPIRGESMYKAIDEAARRVAGDAASASLDRWRDTFGEEAYRFEVDDERRLVFATALDETSHREMREMLEREADQLTETLFGEAPPYYVLVAIPTPEDAQELLDGDLRIGGKYDHGRRQLIARDIGGSLRHEFVHALHYAHMERLGLRKGHPIWIQEGLASLYEHFELSEDGTIRFLPNERTNIANRNAKVGSLPRWSDLFALDGERFMTKAGKLYPIVRSIFEFIAEQRLLAQWYRTYVENYEDDPTGAIALELVFGEPVDTIERQWRDWLKSRPMVDQVIGIGDAWLGVEGRRHGTNDGILVERVVAASPARRAGLRRGDVIVSIDERQTRSVTELQRLIGARQAGDVVKVRYRRDGAYASVEIQLRPRGER
jgi:hypothetical protein